MQNAVTSSQPEPKMRARRRRQWIALAFLVLFALDFGLSRLLHTRKMHDYLTARLAATFGRPVEVSDFEVSLLGRPRLAANSITVGEDPRFGYEYFLRAERLTAGLRWRSLLRGRFEFGTLSFTRPSLNLVRISTGAWNLESWLPRPAAKALQDSGTETATSRGRPEGRIYRIEVEGGRINFKRGVEKHPFALVGVTGAVEQEAPGRWWLDLEARVMRAAVAVQEAGTIRVRGRVGGTAARLRPAGLAITWVDASLADVLRLAWGQDYGIRGRVSVEMTARSGVLDPQEVQEQTAASNSWSFRGVARLRGVHRWDFPPRAGDPGLNLTVEATWWPEQARIALSRGVIEAPRSSLHATGFLTWASRESVPPGAQQLSLQIVSSGMALEDLLAWYRAFRPGVKAGVVLEGTAGIDLLLTGWPLHIERGVLAVEGARLGGAAKDGPVSLSRVLVRNERGKVSLGPVTLTLARDAMRRGPPGETRLGEDQLRFEGEATAAREGKFALSLSGHLEHAENLLAAASALGWNPFPGWSVEGSATLTYRWRGKAFPFALESTGSVELRDLRMQSFFLRQPVLLSSARIEIRPDERRVQFVSAQAFGARWSGTASAKKRSLPWEFVVATDWLDVKELVGWLGAREREGLLARIVPSAPSPADDLGLRAMHAQGRLSVGQLVFAPLALHGVQAQVEFEGGPPWRVRLSNGQADLYGGRLSGAFLAEGGTEPSYRFEGRFDRLSVAALTSVSPALAGRFAGTISGTLNLAARGAPGASLAASVEGRGAFEARGAEIRRLDVLRMVRAAASNSPVDVPAGTSEFPFASGEFRIASGTVQIEKFLLTAPTAELEVAGTVDFSRTLDLRVRARMPQAASKASTPSPLNAEGRSFRLVGRLDAPQFVR